MDLHRVRRLTGVLVTSQLRAGSSRSDPHRFTGRPSLIAVIDAALFVSLFALAGFAVVRLGGLPPALMGGLLSFLPFLPVLSVGAVLVAGVLFELTATARFSGSDAANWLPIDSRSYVLASASAIAYTYSPAVALVLGPVGGILVATGHAGLFLGLLGVSLLGLVQGALLVEIVRSVTQRTGARAARTGRIGLVVRAVVLLVVVLALDLLFNPYVVYAAFGGAIASGPLFEVVPLFWPSAVVQGLLEGAPGLAVAFGAGALGLAVLLLYLAGALRQRYWSVTTDEFRLARHEAGRGHPWLAALGLDPQAASIASKDFRGLTRRRELLPMLIVPFVLAIVVLVEARTGAFGSSDPTILALWGGWGAGFLALLISATSVGQERRALQTLLAAPVAPTTVLRAKFVAAVLPALLAMLAISVLFALLLPVPWRGLLGAAVGGIGAIVALTYWGLAFATRYSDFQDRPRPQYLRPGPMMAATLGGVAVLFGVLALSTGAALGGGRTALVDGLAAVAIVAVVGVAARQLAVRGIDRLFREVPF